MFGFFVCLRFCLRACCLFAFIDTSCSVVVCLCFSLSVLYCLGGIFVECLILLCVFDISLFAWLGLVLVGYCVGLLDCFWVYLLTDLFCFWYCLYGVITSEVCVALPTCWVLLCIDYCLVALLIYFVFLGWISCGLDLCICLTLGFACALCLLFVVWFGFVVLFLCLSLDVWFWVWVREWISLSVCY